MPAISHTFIGRPLTRLDTAIRGDLVLHRGEDTSFVAASVLSAPAPTMLGRRPPAPVRPATSPDMTTISGSSFPRRDAGIDLATVIGAPPGAEPTAEGARPQIRKSLPIGFVVHRYRIEGIIGEGGFGITYRARDLAIDREVAIKELFVRGTCFRAHSNEVMVGEAGRHERLMQWARFYFSEEARITFAMRHELIVRIYDFFKTNNTAYIVYERLEGVDLQQWCEGHRPQLDHGRVCELARALGGALRHVHERGYVHRDLKPANVFIDRDERPVLIDFGAASGMDAPAGAEIMVTPGFAPPEQYDPAVVADARADIYALSATLYWTLAGVAPPPAPARLQGEALKPLASLVDPRFKFGERLYRVVEQGLSLARGERYASVDEMLGDLFPKVALKASGYAAKPLGAKIFVSYRREDSSHFSGRLLDFLEMRFGSETVFFDVQSIPAGIDFWDHIKDVLSQCAVVLVVIGPRWLASLKERGRSWLRPGREDFVAQEIAAAIELNLPIIPVMFDNTPMPRDADLPPVMRVLTKLNAATVGSGPAFRFGVDGIADQIMRIRNMRTVA